MMDYDGPDQRTRSLMEKYRFVEVPGCGYRVEYCYPAFWTRKPKWRTLVWETPMPPITWKDWPDWPIKIYIAVSWVIFTIFLVLAVSGRIY